LCAQNSTRVRSMMATFLFQLEICVQCLPQMTHLDGPLTG
jgi:hypothetical protein